MPQETPLATWQYSGVTYAVAAQRADDGPLLLLVAAVGPGRCERSGHEIRPNDDRELAEQLVRWNAPTEASRAAAAERILAERDD